MLWPDYPQARAQGNLRNALSLLRKLLGDRSSTQPFLLVTRETVCFNPESDFELDVTAFEAQVTAASTTPSHTIVLPAQDSDQTAYIRDLTTAIALLRGPFLEGFSLPDAPAFDEWLLLKREQLNHLAMGALQQVIEVFTSLGNYEQALPYARRQITLEPWMEEAHQQVMRLLALSGQRGAALAQFEACRRILQDDLGVEPCQATLDLYQQIRRGELSFSLHPPGFLHPGQPIPARQTHFVARQSELDRLAQAMDQTLSGQGQVRFVVGSPGAGKTALAERFIQLACAAHPGLAAVRGCCQAYFGRGDPYLPFREVLEMLTGDVEDHWRAGDLSQAQARQLWLLGPACAKALALKGPGLIDVFLPGERLLARAAQTTVSEPDWLLRLREIHKNRQQVSLVSSLQQEDLFHQYGSVLLELARETPLVIFLDDLQWADPGSLGLLFSLGRRLSGARILILGAYRPEELLPDAAGSRRPLAGLVDEFRLLFEDLVIDLDAVEDRGLVDAYLDTEPNRLDASFRKALFEQTHGHPLFTIELLRGMQESGGIIKSRDGEWMASPALAWEDLPPRVEAAIGERIQRLPAGLRRLLEAASIEGERFTLEVLAGVLGASEDQLLHCLSEELDRQHQLVRAEDLVHLNGRRLSRYRFRHILFQRYLHHSLDPMVRAHLHAQVGSILENLYGEQTDEIAAQLARHFELAGNPPKTIDYLYRAGRRAAHLSANAEAIRYFNRALALIPETDLEGRFKLLMGRERVYHNTGQRQVQEKDIQALEALGEALGPTFQAQAILRRAHFSDMTWNLPALMKAAQSAILLGQATGQDEVVVEGLFRQSVSYQPFDAAKAADLAEQALALARQKGLKSLEGDILHDLANCYVSMDGCIEKSLRCAEEAIRIHRARGDRYGEARNLAFRGHYLLSRQDYMGALSAFETFRQMCRETGNRHDEFWGITLVVPLYEFLGRPDLIAKDLVDATEWTRELGILYFQFFSIFHLGLVSYLQGNYPRAFGFAEEALPLSQRGGFTPDDHEKDWWIGRAYGLRGTILSDMGQVDQAANDFLRSAKFFRQSTILDYLQIPLNGLARLAQAGGEKAQALAWVEECLPLLESKTTYGSDPIYFSDYLTVYKILHANQDPRAVSVLAEAHRRLQDQAEHISDEAFRLSFLEAYPWNREIVALWQELQGSSESKS